MQHQILWLVERRPFMAVTAPGTWNVVVERITEIREQREADGPMPEYVPDETFPSRVITPDMRKRGRNNDV